MKKTYMTPAIDVVEIHTASMLAASTFGIDTTDANQITDPEQILSREIFFGE